MQGQVFKIHSDFFYVKTDKGIFECKLREILKKQKQSILVGDFVKLEQINEASMQAFIDSTLKRKNYIPRPKAANISQAIIVTAIKEPDIDFEQLNRYLANCEYYRITPILCFNKCDLDESKDIQKNIKKIYKNLNYKIFFTSALNHIGIKDLRNVLTKNTSIFCGASGAGKSSLVNTLLGSTEIKTKKVSFKTKKGVHTTRHCEIIELTTGTDVVDTPGFSNLKFDFMLPQNIQEMFPEILELSAGCKFSNCLHINEIGCNVLKNIEKIHKTRYDSYIKFIEEARDYKQKVTYNGIKTETKTKTNQNKTMTKISSKKRNISRKTNNQNVDKSINEAL